MYLLIYFYSIIPLFFLKILFQMNVLFMLMCHLVKKSINIGLMLKNVSTITSFWWKHQKANSIPPCIVWALLHKAKWEFCKLSAGKHLLFRVLSLFQREVRPCFPAEGRQRIGLRGTARPRDWAIQSTPASSYCLGRSTFEYSLSLRPNRWERLRRCTAFSPLLFYLQLNAFQMEQLYRKQFR